MSGAATQAVHGNRPRTESLGALRPPVYESAAFEFDSSKAIADAFAGRKPAHTYSRVTNPTVAELESRLAKITGAQGAVAVSSGMAAIATTILTLAQTGDTILTTPYLFGNTYSLFNKTLKRWGLNTKFIDLSDLEAVRSAIDDRTRILFLETIANPQMVVFDIPALAKICRDRGVVLVVDTTATPFLFKSKEAGVQIEILSTTKYVSGGGTSIGGAILDNGITDWNSVPSLAEDVKRFGPFTFLSRVRTEVFRNLGVSLSPHSAYLQTLGLETALLRIRASYANAFAIAQWFENRPETVRVNYPGLPSSPYFHTVNRTLNGQYGGILTIELADRETCWNFMDQLKLVRRATNIHDNRTLIIHPASTIYCEYSEELRQSLGITDGLIRIAVGIEESDDLIEDFRQALEEQ